MFRKLTVFICLIAFAPAAVSAQGITTATAAETAVESTITMLPASDREINLSLTTERSSAVLMAAAETSQGTAMAGTPEHKKEAKSSSFNWSNFAEVHLGDYRWVWWAGAAVALVAIHAGK